MKLALISLCACVAVAAAQAAARISSGDTQWAQAIVLKQEDLRAFDSAPPAGGKTCLPSRLERQTAFARSQQFSSGARSVASRAWIFPLERHARTGFRALVARDYAGCLARQDIVGARIVRTTQKRFGVGTPGDRLRGIRITAQLDQSGTRFTVYVDILFVRRGRAVADAAFTSTGVPFARATEIATVGRMSARMAHPPAGG